MEQMPDEPMRINGASCAMAVKDLPRKRTRLEGTTIDPHRRNVISLLVDSVTVAYLMADGLIPRDRSAL